MRKKKIRLSKTGKRLGRPPDPDKVEVVCKKKQSIVHGRTRTHCLTIRCSDEVYELMKGISEHKNVTMASFIAEHMTKAAVKYAKKQGLWVNYLMEIEGKLK